jgi:two-component system LytT family sensor kinase
MKLHFLKINHLKLAIIQCLIWSFFIGTSLVQFYQSPFKLTIDFYLQWFTAIILFYANYLIFVPKLLLKRKPLDYFICLSSVIVVFVILRNWFFVPHFPKEIARTLPPTRGFGTIFHHIMPSFFYILIAAISTIMKTLSEFYKNQHNRLVGETQKKTAELIYLRKQTNPHFLFNSLNSLYSLAYKKSDLLPDAIVSLSELMRYMLYETDHNVVPLEKELKYINNYIQLQKLRLNDIENIVVTIQGETKDKFIEPLLLIVFIENAFKYGIDYKGAAWVKIFIEIKEKELDFWIENKIGNHSKDEENSGIGIINIQSRLELIYPNAHVLSINTEESKYRVHLNLKLDKIKNVNKQL